MIAALLLAAGESTRMGSPKPLLDWHGRPLIQYQIEQLRDGGCDLVVVVLGHRSDRVHPFVENTGAVIVENPRFREGRATSVRAGAQMVPERPDNILVLGIDQPRSANIVRQVIQAAIAQKATIVIPTHNGRRGHPTAFAGWLLPEIQEVEDETLGLRDVVRRHEAEILRVEVNNPNVLLDLNTPEDYQAAISGRWQPPIRLETRS